ncbi:uncharacterized protein CLAFUR5_08757 [Fulvia fulva]|uniref:Uncharacterized protein n=1 Tax=Passalora fulva TaxID=5499 RepID=A0A9Q8LCP0_PASFU|nr:uncharacterized protein CLAFUR5_08757 [Fulvia fulva]KAK4630334.1 hypothetical protein CLAFUR0_08656 [Fulvia fulva]UJO15050.1 hypothetical protein CLAFUR5_08757 [Fulvia fulva]
MSQGPQRWYDLIWLLGAPLSIYIWNMKHKERIERARALEAQNIAGAVPERQEEAPQQDPFHVFEQSKRRWTPAGKDDEHDRRVAEHIAYEARLARSSPKIVKLASGKTLSLED